MALNNFPQGTHTDFSKIILDFSYKSVGRQNVFQGLGEAKSPPVMSFLFNCGLMCALISVWGSLQLGAMSIFYYTESVGLIEDCEAHDPKNYSDFIERTKKNYKATGTNCLIAAVIYLVTLLLSTGCIWRARKQDRLRAAQLEDDEISCLPPPPKPEIMVKGKPRGGFVARLIGKKTKRAPPAQIIPQGTIDSKDMDILKDEKQVQERAVSEGKKKKKKKDKKKKKRGQE